MVVEVEREHRNVESLLSEILTINRIDYLKFGKHVKVKILNHHQIMDIQEFLESGKCSHNVLMFLYLYLNKSMNIKA